MKIKLTNGHCLESLQICQFKHGLKYVAIKSQNILKKTVKNPVEVQDVTKALKEGFSVNLFIQFVMKTFIVLFCTALFSLTPKHGVSQNNKIVIEEDAFVSVDAVFQIIKSQTDYKFIYYGNLFNDVPKIPLKKGVIRLSALLNQSLSKDEFNVVFTKNNTILINKKTGRINAQKQTVTGTVTDEAGLPVSGATVLIKGTVRGAATNLDGHYTITVPDPANVLVFSSLGLETQEILVGNQRIINVSLKENPDQLGAVTIRAGYYNTTEREKTGSIITIDAKTIEKQPVSNPLAAMQGYLSGVNITQDSGVPGGGFNIQIRGRNSLSRDVSSDPLYIVDGVPYSSESLGDFNNVLSLRKTSPLNLINPSDIASIEVLKDADATAIYGSRGANGVVLITTKKGKIGKTRIKFNVSTSMASVPRSSFIDLLNTEQYLEVRLEALTNDGYTRETLPDDLKISAPDLYAWDQSRYTDWQAVLFGGTAYRKTAQLSFSGGNEQTQFLFSGAYQHENTVFPGDSNYGKASVHSSINHQSKDKRFQINVTTDYATDDNFLPTIAFPRLAYRLAPNAPALYDENGDLNWENNTWQNPLAPLERKFRTQTKNVLMNSVISYRPMPDLEIKTSLGYTDYRLETYNTRPTTEAPPGSRIPKDNFIITSNATSQSWIAEPQIHWKKDWDKASINILVGATFQQKESNRISLFGQGFASDSQILNLSAADNVTVSSDEDSEYNYQAIFGRFNFKWADKYIINLTGRRDGSSRFGPGRQFGNFGAVGLAWLFSKETFLEDNTLLSFGKLRASYGVTGSDNVPDYAFYNSYGISTENYDGSGLEPTRLFNPNFGWEENKKFEAALELGFLQDRMMLTAAWYRNRSSNQLIGIPLPDTTGFSSLNTNFDATVQNTGLEIDFRSINIQKDHLKWTTTFNLSVPKNKLVKFDGIETSTFKNVYIVGEPISIDRLFQTTGVNPETGIYEYTDYNNDGDIDVEDKQWIEHTAPRFFGGLGNTLNYKNWTLDVFFQFKKQKANILQTIGFLPGFFINQHVSALNRWQQAGDQAPVQRYTLSFNTDAGRAYGSGLPDFYRDSNASYADASFIQLRNVTISYTVPKEQIGGMDMNLYLQGQNLLTLTKYIGPDPSQGSNSDGNLPLLRQFTLGLQIGF